jgi:hypothetical protein
MFREGDNQVPPGSRPAEYDESLLSDGVIWVTNSRRVVVCEYLRRFFERDPMLAFVCGRLLVIPFEVHE